MMPNEELTTWRVEVWPEQSLTLVLGGIGFESRSDCTVGIFFFATVSALAHDVIFASMPHASSCLIAKKENPAVRIRGCIVTRGLTRPTSLTIVLLGRAGLEQARPRLVLNTMSRF